MAAAKIDSDDENAPLAIVVDDDESSDDGSVIDFKAPRIENGYIDWVSLMTGYTIRTRYKDGKKHGYEKVYKKGVLCFKTLYKNDECTGQHKYYKNGRLFIVKAKKDDKCTVQTQYDESGNITMIRHYKDDRCVYIYYPQRDETDTHDRVEFKNDVVTCYKYNRNVTPTPKNEKETRYLARSPEPTDTSWRICCWR